VMGGSAILAAAASLREKIRDEAARALACAPEELVIVDGDSVRKSDDRVWSLAELKLPALSATGSFASTKRTYSYGAHAAHVAVDPRTGKVEIIDYVAVEDVGRIINPLTLHGQTVGAIVQGLGGVFLEQLCYDDEAQLMTASFADYLLPTAGDFPEIRVIAMELHPSPHNPLGAKGAGEGGMIPVGGVVANAVAAALASLGVQPKDLPLSPPRVWELIVAAKRDARDGSDGR
jgi:carbon-monoxide dehydrogenase large subunit